jgi:hypothetical protein
MSVQTGQASNEDVELPAFAKMICRVLFEKVVDINQWPYSTDKLNSKMFHRIFLYE